MESLQTARLRHMIATYPETGYRAYIGVRGAHVWLGVFVHCAGGELQPQLASGWCSRRTPVTDVWGVLGGVHYLTRPESLASMARAAGTAGSV
jgi:hypothetical protein